ncbi:hypothetical protein ANN_21721 [Periplaneta americana]|uniref:Uncharacterized protein n=1 Tax=Periplaneta americana TaxID=6978 RepID=A0ABQ8S688_PERAM|nr:hypothetical protein ANN_21721 [Periplaneta americana]
MAGLCEGGNEPPGSLKARKGQLIVDMLNKLRDFSRKLTLFVSQFREGYHGIRQLYPMEQTHEHYDEVKRNDYKHWKCGNGEEWSV